MRGENNGFKNLCHICARAIKKFNAKIVWKKSKSGLENMLNFYY